MRRLVLPNLMVDLLAAGRWKHPGDEPIREVMPWFENPLIFLANADQMRHESRSLDLFADDKRLSELFRVRRGTAASPVDLPCLDAELAILVAINMNPGDDVAIALDYRSDPADPRVLASDFWTDPKQCTWRIVAPALGLNAGHQGGGRGPSSLVLAGLQDGDGAGQAPGLPGR